MAITKWVGVDCPVQPAIRVLTAGPGGESPAGGTDPLRGEFLVAISDPGAVRVFAAFVPQFVDPACGPIPLQPAVLAGTACVAVGAGTRRAGPTRRAAARPDKATGAVLPGTAGASAVSRT